MNIVTLLFSFSGRINRAKYWLAALIYFVVVMAAGLMVIAAAGDINPDNLWSIAGVGLTIWSIGLLLFVGLTWSGLATGIKRLHDRDRSGWLMLLFWLGPGFVGALQSITTSTTVAMLLALVSLGIAVWGLVELGFLRGTAGPNRFGPDPLNRLSNEPLR